MTRSKSGALIGLGAAAGLAVSLVMGFGHASLSPTPTTPTPNSPTTTTPIAPVSPTAEAASAESRPVQPVDSVSLARSLSSAFKDVARRVEPSVVHIVAKRRSPIYERVGFFEVRPTGRTRIEDAGLGSGVIVSKDGVILTNNHVVAPADLLEVHLRDGRVVPGTVVGKDSLTDLAVIKIAESNLTPVEFADSDSIEVGEWVVAIGSPFGFANTVTAGIVSAKSRSNVPLRELSDEAYKDFIQTDAAINPGNSGGALLNLEGKLVGINSAIASRAGGSEGIGFAIPSKIASAVLDSIVKNGRVVRGWLGATFQDLAGMTPSLLPANATSGVLIADVIAGSPAENGLRAGDVVTRYQNRPMLALSTLRAAVALTPPGTKAEFDLIRDGKPTKVTVTIGDAEAVPYEAIGIDVRTLSEREARRMGYRNIRGVIVTKVRSGGLGEQNGAQTGDIILKVDGQDVLSPADFAAAIAKGDLDKGVSLNVIREDTQGQLRITRNGNKE